MILCDTKGKIEVGNVYNSNLYGRFKVVEYRSSKDVLVRFLDTGFEVVVQSSQIRLGTIRDRLAPTISGVGVIGNKYEITDEFKKLSREYCMWVNMLRRCYDSKDRNINQTYINCSVSENFKSFEYFYEWCQDQIGFENDDWHLDKDFLFKGNKVYSETNCVFIPRAINNLLTTRVRFRGDFPLGVHFSTGKGKFIAQTNEDGVRIHLGCFENPEDAFNMYKQHKEVYLKVVANRWKDKIDPRVYEALMNWEIEISD